MKLDDLFDQRSLVAVKLKCYIRERGFTKASIARKGGISRIMLDKLLEGNVDNKHAFNDCVSKALAVLNISSDDLIDFEPRLKPANAVSNECVPMEYQMSATAQKQYGLLTLISVQYFLTEETIG